MSAHLERCLVKVSATVGAAAAGKKTWLMLRRLLPPPPSGEKGRKNGCSTTPTSFYLRFFIPKKKRRGRSRKSLISVLRYIVVSSRAERLTCGFCPMAPPIIEKGAKLFLPPGFTRYEIRRITSSRNCLGMLKGFLFAVLSNFRTLLLLCDTFYLLTSRGSVAPFLRLGAKPACKKTCLVIIAAPFPFQGELSV